MTNSERDGSLEARASVASDALARPEPHDVEAKADTAPATPPVKPRRAAPGAEARPATRRALDQVLHRTFGLKRLREGQAEVITHVLDGRHTLAVMPTGAGKSLCYQLPAMLLPGLTVVVSPLIALMKDQCDGLRELGIDAHQLNSAIDAETVRAAEEAMASGHARIVFTTPERIGDPGFHKLLQHQPVSLLVIDEAHCISQWGHDFRPAFLEIGTARSLLHSPTVLALTATATDEVAADVARQLGVKRFELVRTGVYRPNLHYAVQQVTREDEKLARAVQWVRANPGSGIVYAATIKAVETVYQALLVAGESVTRYHGRLSVSERRENQETFMRDAARVIVATNAFGLGIDKPATRFVLHYQMPASIDAYYQESGRAGRDGAAANCTLLFLHSDKAVQQFFLAGRYPDIAELSTLYAALLHERDDGEPWTLERLVEGLDLPRGKLQVSLRLLRHQRVVAQQRNGTLRLQERGLDSAGLEKMLGAYRDKRNSDRAMLEQMVFYGQTGFCRWRVLLEHFGEMDGFERCHRCDSCARIDEAARRAGAAPPAPIWSVEGKPESGSSVDTGESVTAAAGQREPDGARVPQRLAPGTQVQVPRYGRGVVEAADSQTVTVAFTDNQSRCFLATYVKTVRH